MAPHQKLQRQRRHVDASEALDRRLKTIRLGGALQYQLPPYGLRVKGHLLSSSFSSVVYGEKDVRSWARDRRREQGAPTQA
jgi:hypothetical protein